MPAQQPYIERKKTTTPLTPSQKMAEIFSAESKIWLHMQLFLRYLWNHYHGELRHLQVLKAEIEPWTIKHRASSIATITTAAEITDLSSVQTAVHDWLHNTMNDYALSEILTSWDKTSERYLRQLILRYQIDLALPMIQTLWLSIHTKMRTFHTIDSPAISKKTQTIGNLADQARGLNCKHLPTDVVDETWGSSIMALGLTLTDRPHEGYDLEKIRDLILRSTDPIQGVCNAVQPFATKAQQTTLEEAKNKLSDFSFEMNDTLEANLTSYVAACEALDTVLSKLRHKN